MGMRMPFHFCSLGESRKRAVGSFVGITPQRHRRDARHDLPKFHLIGGNDRVFRRRFLGSRRGCDYKKAEHCEYEGGRNSGFHCTLLSRVFSQTKIRISLSSRILSRISAALSKSRFLAASFISFVRRLIALSRSSSATRSRRLLPAGPARST